MRDRPLKGFWTDTGRTPFISAGRDVSISPGATVIDSVIWDHASVASGVVVSKAIVADNANVTGTVSYMALNAARMNDPLVSHVLRRLGWPAHRTLALPMPPRGSARTFTRLVCGARTAMLIQYTRERPENALYAAHAAFLRRIGVSAPRLLLDLPGEQACVVEDAGDRCLQNMVLGLSPNADAARIHMPFGDMKDWGLRPGDSPGIRPAPKSIRNSGGSSTDQILQWYQRTLDTVIRLHERGARAARQGHLPLSQPFSRHLYEWEQDLFAEQFLRRHVRAGNRRLSGAVEELRSLIPRLLRGKRVLVHRDLQSSNVLIANGRPVLIDFQGMRLGPAAYDLASLLCDPYVSLPLALRESLLEYYAERTVNGPAARQLFWVAAVERLAQALGAFGRLGANPTTAGFLRHIPAGVRELRLAVKQVGGMPVLAETLDAYGVSPS